MRRSVCAIGAVAVMFVGTIAVQGQDAARALREAAGRPDGPIVPVYQEPHHRQVFQNGPTRILDLQLPPGETSWFHDHKAPILYLSLSSSQLRTQNLGQDWSGAGDSARGGAPADGGNAATAGGGRRGAAPATPPAGRRGREGGAGAGGPARVTSTISYFEQPLTHRIQNIGTDLLRAMVVINETPGDESTSEQVAGFSLKPEFTNRWFRAYRIALAPGEKTPAHTHRVPVVILQTIEGQGVGAGGMKWEFNEPGQWGFFAAGDRHELANVGSGRFEVFEIELRQKLQ